MILLSGISLSLLHCNYKFCKNNDCSIRVYTLTAPLECYSWVMYDYISSAVQKQLILVVTHLTEFLCLCVHLLHVLLCIFCAANTADRCHTSLGLIAIYHDSLLILGVLAHPCMHI